MPRTKELSHSALSRTLTNALVAVSSTAAWPIPECPFTCTNVTALCCLTCTSNFFPGFDCCSSNSTFTISKSSITREYRSPRAFHRRRRGELGSSIRFIANLYIMGRPACVSPSIPILNRSCEGHRLATVHDNEPATGLDRPYAHSS